MSKVLVVDDERQIRRFLRATLATQGYEVMEAASVAEALNTAADQQPDMVILDLGLPDGDGLVVVQHLREWTKIPILILSVRGQDADKIAALDAGADDYLTKPFSTGELMARMRAAMRRVGAREGEDPVLTVGDLRIDEARHVVTLKGEEVHLTTTEYAILKALATHAGKVITHRQLLEMVWGTGYESDTHLLRVNISNLRRKIEPNPLQPTYLVTELGVGYRLRTMEPVR
ncbi:MAG TPA: response regulator [Symbiobacteriaceae bacterium]|nr:response regulator [Symbiobacteriaceae bacterium]